MRFVSNGPSIPDELLVARDAGDVLFFCGAGVSIASARLPDFYTLAKNVMETLGVIDSSDAKIVFDAATKLDEEIKPRNLGGLVAADRLFGLLEREFDGADVRAAVAQALRPHEGPHYDLTPHRDLLALSAGPDGASRLVTTNFDLLFEECDHALPRSGPGQLPDPRSDRNFRGVVHLHGRVNETYNAAHDDELVLSSAEFGNAYLADGWATRYINQLLQRFQIVFVGYSADDPPVQYLLEAMSRFGTATRKAMYAFQYGSEQQSIAQWQHKGVTPLPFDNFPVLWQTISAWASRARDVDGWHDRLISMAAAGPENLQPHERGMVAHLAATVDGSHRLAMSDEPIPATWLFVFDKQARYVGTSPDRAMFYRDSAYQIFAKARLDSDDGYDSSPDNVDASHSPPDAAWDAFRICQADIADAPYASLARLTSDISPPLKRRFENLAGWLLRVAHQRAAMIWAAAGHPLHPWFRERLEGKLLFDERFVPNVRRQWRLLLAGWASDTIEVDVHFHSVERSVERNGWDPLLVRDAIRLYQPRLTVAAGYASSPFEDDAEDVVHVEVDYVHPGECFDFDHASLPYALSLLRQALESGVQLERLNNPNFEPWFDPILGQDGKPRNSEFTHGIGKTVTTYVEMLSKLIETNPAKGKAELDGWVDHSVLATRVRIATMALLDVAAFEILIARANDHAFWDDSLQHDLSVVLGQRWAALSDATRQAIAHRIVHGMIPSYGSAPMSEEDQAHLRLSRIYALKSMNVDLTATFATEIATMKAALPEWTEEAWRDQPPTGVQSVNLDTDCSSLLSVPLSSLVEVALEKEVRESHWRTVSAPFRGLIEKHPAVAIRALDLAVRKGIFVKDFWVALLVSPRELTDRQAALLSRRLAGLPEGYLAQIRRRSAAWLNVHAERLCRTRSDRFAELWSALFLHASLASVAPPRPQAQWREVSPASTSGQLASALFSGFATDIPNGALPTTLKSCIEQLLQLPAPHRQHAIFCVAQHLDWMYGSEPEWVTDRLLPLSTNADSAAPFIQGTLSKPFVLSQSVVMALGEALLQPLYDGVLSRPQVAVLASTILSQWIASESHAMSDRRFREILVRSNNDFRDSVIRHLVRSLKTAGGLLDDAALRFMGAVWPRQKVAKSAEMTVSLIKLALAVPDRFTEAVGLLMPRFVASSDRSRASLFQQVDDRIINEHAAALVDVLWAVLPPSSRMWWGEVESLIDRIPTPLEKPQSDYLAELRRRAKYRL